MDKLLEHELPKGIIKAIYRKAVLPEYIDNPLVSALPPFHQAAEMMTNFGRFPSISDSDRLLPAADRMLAVLRINNYLQPLTSHFEIIDKIGLNIRAGYTYRNPASPDYQKELTKFYRQAMDGITCPIGDSGPSTAPSFAIFGTSGVGKSTVVERALSFLPQVLHHEELGLFQVVWMKLDCPLDGRLKQLLDAMLVNFDNLLGTSYADIFKNTTTIDKLILVVARLSKMHHLGMLVIDEIQNLLVASGVGQKTMLNFFLTFANVIKVPLLAMGTPSAIFLLDDQFRSARRIEDFGTVSCDRLPLGEEWTHFLNCLWEYQWTLHPVPLSESLLAFLHDKTQGIHALVVRLFQLSQLQAIRDGYEELTEELIGQVAFERFKLVAPMLDELRGNSKKGSKKGDKKVDKHFEDLFIWGLKKMTEEVGHEANLAVLKAQAQSKNQIAEERRRAVSALLVLGYGEDELQKAVTGLFNANPNMTSDTAVRTILESVDGHTGNIGVSEGESLKAIIQAGAESGMSPTAALTAAGVITSPLREK